MSAKKTAESDGLIVNSMERLACAVSPPPCFLSVGGERGRSESKVYSYIKLAARQPTSQSTFLERTSYTKRGDATLL